MNYSNNSKCFASLRKERKKEKKRINECMNRNKRVKKEEVSGWLAK